MILSNRWSQIASLVVLGLLSVTFISGGQASDGLHILSSPADQSTAVRFFFHSGDYFHVPLIFRVGPDDARLNTAPLLPDGRTAYITASEMDQLKRGLERLGLSWQESKREEAFGDPLKIPLVYQMTITVVSSKGTATAGFDPTKICETLPRLDSTLTTPRALWEFQVFRSEYRCKVPGLNGQAYPDHWAK